MKIVAEVTCAEFDMMRGRRIVIEIHLIIPVADAGMIVGKVAAFVYCIANPVAAVCAGVGIHLIFVVSDGGVAEQFLVEDIIPADGCNSVSPVERHFIFIGVAEIIIIAPCGGRKYTFTFERVMIFSFIKTEKETASV